VKAQNGVEGGNDEEEEEEEVEEVDFIKRRLEATF
jgi:hypothetical protein